MKRIAWILIGAPVAVALIALAVVNRHPVTLVLDPFRPETPALALVLPFFVYLFAALVVGVILGGLSTWVTQGRWRRAARLRAADAKRWQAEADRLTREREAEIAGRGRALAAPGRRNAA